MAHKDIKRKEAVSVVSLDEWADGKRIDILKLDLEGYDLEALKDAKKLLKSSVKVIYIETRFNPVPGSNTLFCELVRYLNKYNFKLFNLYGMDTMNDGKLVGANALFVKT